MFLCICCLNGSKRLSPTNKHEYLVVGRMAVHFMQFGYAFETPLDADESKVDGWRNLGAKQLWTRKKNNRKNLAVVTAYNMLKNIF